MPVSNKNRNIGIESPDFSLYAFDENANGTVWGEGVVIFVLRRLKDAQKNNEHIYGIIKGSATNQDGMSAGITAPNPKLRLMFLGRHGKMRRLGRKIWHILSVMGLEPTWVILLKLTL